MPTRTGKSGPFPLSTQRDQYLRLMSKGMTNSQACREVGVNRRTGTRWRYGRTIKARHGDRIYEPIGPLPEPISARYLSEDERIVIADGRRAELS